MDTLRPIHALIFLFKYVGGTGEKTEEGVEVDPLDNGVWFANQVPEAPVRLHEAKISLSGDQ